MNWPVLAQVSITAPRYVRFGSDILGLLPSRPLLRVYCVGIFTLSISYDIGAYYLLFPALILIALVLINDSKVLPT